MNTISIMFSFAIPPQNPFAPIGENQHVKLIRDIPGFNTLPKRLAAKLLPIATQQASFEKNLEFDEVCLVLEMVEPSKVTNVVKLREDISERCIYCTIPFEPTSIEKIPAADREDYLFELCLEAIESFGP